ncbi:2OG-Fe(II) oxygenase [Fimbriiglobus ruber]|uniref:Fe2OG dioxygenase domain-containing protein n=1 Tax=Fimbriiglobus ruber TaxID=1908690 RepID=A0A225D3Q5_9BACT|nr:2OG-Fe(II) oxygenase [Fimbriiglobus ruber]OWK36220.1 hypothetical protein FRUB_08783 [Fimbriiglobus ruber]
MASSISDQLLQALKAVDRPGSFAAAGSGPAPLPGLEVADFGLVGLPLNDAQAKQLKKVCRQAPYGKGEETLVDTSVRRVWQLDADRFSLTNPDWQRYLSVTVETVQRELGLEGQEMESHLYNLLLYEKGSFFLPHRDGEKLDRMVATLVVVLPSAFEGGELVVRHDGREQVIDFGTSDRNPFHTHFAAFYADCEHEVRPLRKGYRLCLVYNLALAKSKKAITAPRTGERVDAVADILRAWSDDDPPKLAVALEHQYTQDGLVWDALKGMDRTRAKVLADAATRAGCKTFLALLTLQESGSADESYVSPRRGRRYYDDDDEEGDADSYEMDEIISSELTADQWSDAAGNRPPFGRMEVELEEIVPPDAIVKVKPEQSVSGYTGNEGLTLERWYRQAAIFLWPEAHHFQVLCDSGLETAAAELQEMVTRSLAAKRADAAELREECVRFADTIMNRWIIHDGTRGTKPAALLMPSLVLLDDGALIGAFLTQVVARDPGVDPDDSFVAVCGKHGLDNFRAELAAIFDGTTGPTLGRNVRLLERLCPASPRMTGKRLAVCQSLAQKVVSVLERVDLETPWSDWRIRRVVRAELLVELTRVLITTGQIELLGQVVTYTLSAPQLYTLPAHVAALTTLGPWFAKHVKKPNEILAKWLDACCEQLEALTAQEPAAPKDFRREANVSCTCADCDELRQFLKNPAEKVHRFRVRQDRRNHLGNIVQNDRLDVTCVTDSSGSPHTLVCTKSTASYEAKLKTYHEHLAQLATLRSIRKGLPV